MRKFTWSLPFLAFIAAVVVGTAVQAGEMMVKDAVAHLTPTGSGGAYMMIHNGGKPDRLLKATSTAARKVQLHITKMKDGVMRMREVDGLAVPANGMLALKRGGAHLMMMGVRKGLKPGEMIDVTLHFEHAGAVTVQAKIQKPGMGRKKAGHGHSHGHKKH